MSALVARGLGQCCKPPAKISQWEEVGSVCDRGWFPPEKKILLLSSSWDQISYSLLTYMIFSVQMDLQSEIYFHFNKPSLMENTLLYSSPTKEE